MKTFVTFKKKEVEKSNERPITINTVCIVIILTCKKNYDMIRTNTVYKVSPF
jgi:hypothetical protein